MGFGELLREYREQAGFSQNALAHAAGLDPTHLSRMERSQQGPPRMETAVKLARALGLSLADERAQRLLESAGLRPPVEGPMRPATLGAPAPVNVRPIQATLRDLRVTLLQAVELIAELEANLNEEARRR